MTSHVKQHSDADADANGHDKSKDDPAQRTTPAGNDAAAAQSGAQSAAPILKSEDDELFDEDAS